MGRKKKNRGWKQRYWNWSWGSNYWDEKSLTHNELADQLMPLTQSLQKVDDMAAKFRLGGARVGDLQELQRVLLNAVNIEKKKFSLVNPESIRNVIYDMCDDLHLEIQEMPDQFPCYLLCIVSRRWDGPNIVLHELHLSPRNCFSPDRRFIMLFRSGRTRLFLRLSIFRDRLYEHLQGHEEQMDFDEECDDILDKVGALVLGAAWYEDQRLPFHVSDVFGLENFRSVMELLGFILGTDLYKVKTALREDADSTIDFFEHVYVNRPLARLLRSMSQPEFINFSELEKKAGEAYKKLNIAFSDFLATGNALDDLERFPLYKIVLGFFFNLNEVANKRFWKPNLEEAISAVESEADGNSQAILSVLT